MAMKLVTKTMLKSIPKLYATENTPLDEKVIHCKFFGAHLTFYVAEALEEPNGDITFFGFVYNASNPHGSEWGYFTLRQLESIKLPPFGLGLERDKYFRKTKFSVIRDKNFIY